MANLADYAPELEFLKLNYEAEENASTPDAMIE